MVAATCRNLPAVGCSEAPLSTRVNEVGNTFDSRRDELPAVPAFSQNVWAMTYCVLTGGIRILVEVPLVVLLVPVGAVERAGRVSGQ